MLDSDEQSSNTLFPSDFDIIRLTEASPGDRINHEIGNWSVLVYDKSYVLLLNDSKKHSSYMEFDNLENLIRFLKEN